MRYIIVLLLIFSNFSIYAQGSYDWNDHNDAMESIDWGNSIFGILILVGIIWIINVVSEGGVRKVDTKEEYKQPNRTNQKNDVGDSISFENYLNLENQVRDFYDLHIKKGTKVIRGWQKGIVISVSQKGAYKTAKVLFEDKTAPQEIIDINWLQLDVPNLIQHEALIIQFKEILYNYATNNISIGTVVEHPSKGIGKVISIGKKFDFDTISSKSCPKILFTNGDKCNFMLERKILVLKILKL